MTRRLARRGMRALAAVVAAAVLLTGCVSWFMPSRPPATSTPTGEEVAAELVPYYHQIVRWTGCGNGLQCATVTAPLDWDDPAADTIELALIRQHATGGAPRGSLLVNPGGPGGSGVAFIRDSIDFATSETLQREFDVVGFDPRGVGESTPVRCTEDDAELDEYIYGIVPGERGTDAWIAAAEQSNRAFGEGCLEHTGPLLAHVDTVSAARDLDLLRAVLGDEKLNYLGYSYGTYLGTIYAQLFPEKVGRMVLDGAVDPTVGDLDALATQMAGFDSALRAYMEWCLPQSDCPFRGDADSALRSIRQMLETVDGRGFRASDGRVLDSATVATGIIFTLYSESYWPYLSELFAQLRKGDADTVFIYADAYNGREAGGGYSDNSGDIYTAVTCDEGTLATDGVDVFAGLERIDRAAPILGRYAAYDDYAVLKAVCSNWPAEVAELPTDFSAPGAAPIMVIGTTNDPATPYANAQVLAGLLSSGFLVTYQGEGHTIYAQGVRCIDDTVDAYLISGKVPASDPMC